MKKWPNLPVGWTHCKLESKGGVASGWAGRWSQREAQAALFLGNFLCLFSPLVFFFCFHFLALTAPLLYHYPEGALISAFNKFSLYVKKAINC